MDAPPVYDQNGNEQSWGWLVTNFGPVAVERSAAAGGQVFRIVELRDSEGPAVLNVTVRGADSQPLAGVNVARYWPDAPQLPDWPPPISRWQPRGVFGETKPDGTIGFGIGRGDYYWPPKGGVSAVWVADARGPSDMMTGLGMLGGTNHRHVDVVYQLVDAMEDDGDDDGDDVQPPEGQWELLLSKLDRIIELLKKQAG